MVMYILSDVHTLLSIRFSPLVSKMSILGD